MKFMHPNYKWFPGLNALRFMAASLVVIMHTHLGMKQAGLPTLPEFPILLKGFSAVSFFFVLSGFLITYLLLKEQESSNTINVKAFYWRRVFRIWPLYFLIVAFGFLFYWKIVPNLGIAFDIKYPKSLAVIFYALFAANLMNSLYHVGGILHITWSIAVEEQFYLFWAPLVKKFYRQLPLLILVVGFGSYAVSVLNAFNVFQLSEGWQLFVRTLQFHYMAAGSVTAYLLYRHHDWLLNLKIFKSKGTQITLLSLLLAYYLFYQKSFLGEVFMPIPLAMLYSWLILNVSVNPKRILKLETKLSDTLGNLSYGIYMLHMPIVYGYSFLMKSLPVSFQGTSLYYVSFYVGVMLSSIVIAKISHLLLEKPINTAGKKWLSRSKDKVNQQGGLIMQTKPLSI